MRHMRSPTCYKPPASPLFALLVKGNPLLRHKHCTTASPVLLGAKTAELGCIPAMEERHNSLLSSTIWGHRVCLHKRHVLLLKPNMWNNHLAILRFFFFLCAGTILVFSSVSFYFLPALFSRACIIDRVYLKPNKDM